MCENVASHLHQLQWKEQQASCSCGQRLADGDMVFCHELMEDIGILGCKSTCTRINGLADIAVFPELLHDPIIVGSFLTQKV